MQLLRPGKPRNHFLIRYSPFCSCDIHILEIVLKTLVGRLILGVLGFRHSLDLAYFLQIRNIRYYFIRVLRLQQEFKHFIAKLNERLLIL